MKIGIELALYLGMKKLIFVSLSLVSLSLWGASCDELPVGDSMKVKLSFMKSRTNIEHKYTLKRVSETHYEAFLNLDFKNDKKLPEEEKVEIDGFRQKVAGCYERFNERLKDEKGRSIALKLFNKDDHLDIKTPPKVKITIKDFTFRSSSHAYSSEIDCETIIHESFHLLGLTDEYVEEDNKLNPNLLKRLFKKFVTDGDSGAAFDCRAVGPVNSLMHNQWFLNSDIPVLFSAQMDAIIYPNCGEQNQEYYQCVQKAYRTSSRHGSIGGCGNIPEVCKTFNWLLSKDSPLRDTEKASLRFSERKEMREQFLLNQ